MLPGLDAYGPADPPPPPGDPDKDIYMAAFVERIGEIVRAKGTVAADDEGLVPSKLPPAKTPNWRGSGFTRAKSELRMRRIGYHASTSPARHSNPVGEWALIDDSIHGAAE